MIAQLTTYKQAVITETVTKGLDPNVKMKDSGVEWIGEIPEHWDVCRLKYLTNGNLQYGANESGVTYDANLPRYVRITDILDNTLREDITKLSLTEEQAKDYILQNNDLLFARSGATVGKAFIYDELYGRCAFAGYLIRASINNENSAKFVYYYTQTSMYEEWKKQVFVQATIQNIGADKYAQLPIVTPSLSEQQSIANYLDQKCKEIDELISVKKEKIEKLKAYKKSVIYEYVTGKKQVN
jgi:type I restriction enzyme S subunit